MGDRFRCVAMDPPWNERGGGKSKRGADRHYPLLKTDDIIDVVAAELGMYEQTSLADGMILGSGKWTHGADSKVADSAHLWMWITDTYMMNGDGMKLARALDFRPVASWPWVKMETTGPDHYMEPGLLMLKPSDCDDGVCRPDDYLQIGLGQYGRKAHEWLVLCTRGAACVPPPSRRPPSVIFAPRSSRHSEKPDAAYTDVIEVVSQRTPRLEMFAREPRDGWTVWGNEVP